MKPSVMDNAKVWISADQLEQWLAPVFSRVKELEAEIELAWTRYNNALRESDRTHVLYGHYPSTPALIKEGDSLIKAAKAANDGLIFLSASDAKKMELAGSSIVDLYLEEIRWSAEFLEHHKKKIADPAEDMNGEMSSNKAANGRGQVGGDPAARGTDPLVIGAILFVCAMFFVIVLGLGR